ncbi:MAG: hypothetical protein ABL858_02390 [Candidatus Nitrotoga sp.]
MMPRVGENKSRESDPDRSGSLSIRWFIACSKVAAASSRQDAGMDDFFYITTADIGAHIFRL